MNDSIEQLLDYVYSAWRFKWLAIGLAWVVFVAGWVFVGFQKDVYEASARVFFNPSSDLRSLLDNQIIDSNLDDELSMVREVMLTSVQVQKVAPATYLDTGIETEDEMQKLVEQLKTQIQITKSGESDRRGNQENFYAISFQHQYPSKAVEVVDTLLNNFIEDTLSSKLSSSITAEKFLNNQVNEYEKRLSVAESNLAAFNRRNFKRLPGNLGSYFQTLQTDAVALDTARKDLTLAKSRLAQIELQLLGEAPGSATGTVDPNSIEARIHEHETNLDGLLLRYTEDHPDVSAAREAISRLEQKKAKELAERAGEPYIDPNNPVYQAAQIAKNEVETEIAGLEADALDRERRLTELRELVDEMPQVEAELAQLNRDYDVIHEHYESLLESLERERLSRQVVQSESQEFRIIDPPTATVDPVAPNRLILIALVFMAAVGGALGIAFLYSQIRPVFNLPQLLEIKIGLPVLGTIHNVGTATNSWSVLLFSLCSVALGIAFFGAVGAEFLGSGIRFVD